MNAEKFSQKTFSGAVVSSSMRLKAIDIIDGESIATVLDDEGDEWKCRESEGDVTWESGDWLTWRRKEEE